MAPLVAVRTHSVNAVPIAGPMSYMIRDYSSVNVPSAGKWRQKVRDSGGTTHTGTNDTPIIEDVADRALLLRKGRRRTDAT